MSNTHFGNVQPAIDYEEHARIGGIDGKKVFVFDHEGNQIVAFGDATTYTTQFDFESGSNPIYIGRASPGSATSSALWQIKKLAYDASGNITSIKYAAGSDNFNQIWDSRASFSYS